MRVITTAAALIGLAVATPALAQSTTTPAPTAAQGQSAGQAAGQASHDTTATGTNGNGAGNMTPGAMQASVKHDLEQAGFTDVQVLPSSFLVRAKDKQGRPVMMVINPDSVTEITSLPAAPNSAAPNPAAKN